MIDPAKVKRILFVMMGGIGNMILLTPAVRAVREKFPQAEIGMLVGPFGAENVFRGSNWVDRFIVYNPLKFSFGGFWRAFRELRAFRPDLTITATGGNPLKSSLLCWLAGAKWRIGEDIGGKKHFYTDVVKYEHQDHEIIGNLKMSALTGADTKNTGMFFSILDSDEEEAAKALQSAGVSPGNLLAVHPGSGKHMSYKRWDKSRFAEVIRRAERDLGVRVIILGGKDEIDLATEVAGLSGAGVSLAGKLSLGGTAALLRRCQVLLSNDSGVMHIGAAVGTRVLAIFGPTMHWKTGPYGAKHTIIRRDLPCSPCYHYSKPELKCHCECLNNITVEEVFDQLKEILK